MVSFFVLWLALQTYDETVRQGIAARDASRFAEAERSFRDAIALDPLEDQAKLLLTNLLLDTARPAEALVVIEPLVASVPEADRSPVINTLYGLSLAQSGRHEEAVSPLRAVIAVQPRRTKALFHLGRSLQTMERWEEAAAVYRRGLGQPPPENIRFAVGLARCLIRLAQWDAARIHLDAFIARHPRVARAWLLRGIVYFEQGDYSDSVTTVMKARELGYDAAEVDLRLGMAHGMQGQFDRAQESLDRALEREPRLATAHYFKGLFLFQEGEQLAAGGDNPFGVHAVRRLERSLELAPNLKTHLALAEVQLRLRLNASAVASARAASAAPDLSPRAFHLMALAHHELLEYEPAERAYEAAAAAGADSVELYHDWGNLLAVMGRWEEAKQMLAAAEEREPDFLGTLVQLGVVHLNLGDHEAALQYLERVVELDDAHAEAWYQKGVVESRQNRPEAAASSWERALELDPEQSRLYYRLGAELVKLGRVDERARLLEEFQKRERQAERAAQQSEQLENLLAGAVAASETGEDARVVALLEEARNLAPDDPRPYVYFGDFHLSRSELDAAERVLEDGLKRMPDALALHQTLLSVYTAKGDSEAAQDARTKIRAIINGPE